MLQNPPITHGSFAWLPVAKEQAAIVQGLYDLYCKRFKLPGGGVPLANTWLAIVALNPDGSYGKIGGVVGVNADAPKGILEVAHLYVYPTRVGAAAFQATLEKVCQLYDSGEAAQVCCHVVNQNERMDRKVKAVFGSRGARPIATLWALGVRKSG